MYLIITVCSQNSGVQNATKTWKTPLFCELRFFNKKRLKYTVYPVYNIQFTVNSQNSDSQNSDLLWLSVAQKNLFASKTKVFIRLEKLSQLKLRVTTCDCQGSDDHDHFGPKWSWSFRNYLIKNLIWSWSKDDLSNLIMSDIFGIFQAFYVEHFWKLDIKIRKIVLKTNDTRFCKLQNEQSKTA